ncbi:MAG: hypothetical protein OXH99_13620 [Bryobacterales bacterium]|nr:hypothetical protein [Bryobacterales bacterium]
MEKTAKELKRIREYDERELLDSLDPGIRNDVRIPREANVDTIQSCEGGPRHSRAFPFVQFSGGSGEGYRVMNMVINTGMPVARIGRYWNTPDRDMDGAVLGNRAMSVGQATGLSFFFP